MYAKNMRLLGTFETSQEASKVYQEAFARFYTKEESS